MRFFAVIILAFLILKVSAQRKPVYTYYAEGGLVTDSARSTYYSVRQPDEVTFNSYFTKTNSPRTIEEPTGNRKGEVVRTSYYESGEVMAKGVTYNGQEIGKESYLYKNGKPLIDYLYPDEPPRYGEDPQPVKILQYWDESGSELLVNGNGKVTLSIPSYCESNSVETGEVLNGLKEGVWNGTTCSSGEYVETYKNGFVESGTLRKDGNTYTYTKLMEGAQPKDGLLGFYKAVNKNMIYPKDARRKGIEGKVFVEFVVDKDGSLRDFRIAKGIGASCDEEALEAVKKTPSWKPGYHRGMPVKQRMILPITFKLG
jgi:TonB family protein